MLDELSEMNIKRLKHENSYLNMKIDRYTNLIVEKSFTGVNAELLERYTAKMMDRKVMNMKLIEAYEQGLK